MKFSIIALACALSFVPVASALADETTTTTTIQQDTMPIVPAPSTTVIEQTPAPVVVTPAPTVVVEKKHHHLINLPFVHVL